MVSSEDKTQKLRFLIILHCDSYMLLFMWRFKKKKLRDVQQEREVAILKQVFNKW